MGIGLIGCGTASFENDVVDNNTSTKPKTTETGQDESTDTVTVHNETSTTATEEQEKIVKRHNYYRNLVSVPALVWDNDLAKHAQTWANYLAENYTNKDAKAGRLPHARVFQTNKHFEDEWYEGENIATTTKHIGYVAEEPIDTSLEYVFHAPKDSDVHELLDVNGAVDAWASEAFYYDYDTNKAKKEGKIVGHYTQIVWADSTKVGCGKAISKTYTFFNGVKDVYFEWVVCRYSTPGNIVGQKPYTK